MQTVSDTYNQPKTNTAQPTEQFWNSYAKSYDSVENLNPHQEMLQSVVDLVPGNAKKILDAGCGSGALLKLLRANDTTRELYGIDFAKEMLAKAKTRLPGVKFEVANLNNTLPFSNESFDCVVCTNAIYAVDNPKDVIEELIRVTAPNGMVIVSTPKRKAKGHRILRHHLRQVTFFQGVIDMLKFVSCIIPNLRIERMAARDRYHFLTRDQILKCADQVEIHSSTFADQNWLFSILLSNSHQSKISIH